MIEQTIEVRAEVLCVQFFHNPRIIRRRALKYWTHLDQCFDSLTRLLTFAGPEIIPSLGAIFPAPHWWNHQYRIVLKFCFLVVAKSRNDCEAFCFWPGMLMLYTMGPQRPHPRNLGMRKAVFEESIIFEVLLQNVASFIDTRLVVKDARCKHSYWPDSRIKVGTLPGVFYILGVRISVVAIQLVCTSPSTNSLPLSWCSCTIIALCQHGVCVACSNEPGLFNRTCLCSLSGKFS